MKLLAGIIGCAALLVAPAVAQEEVAVGFMAPVLCNHSWQVEEVGRLVYDDNMPVGKAIAKVHERQFKLEQPVPGHCTLTDFDGTVQDVSPAKRLADGRAYYILGIDVEKLMRPIAPGVMFGVVLPAPVRLYAFALDQPPRMEPVRPTGRDT